MLTDQQQITCKDLADWLRNRELHSHPFVLINACQGGQMRTLFYQTVAAELLRRKAACLIGSQIDMPAIVASEFAQRFFSMWLKTGTKAGPIMRDVASDLLTHFRNPLGLAYSMYRGIDCLLTPIT
jgi:hypothetical protein